MTLPFNLHVFCNISRWCVFRETAHNTCVTTIRCSSQNKKWSRQAWFHNSHLQVIVGKCFISKCTSKIEATVQLAFSLSIMYFLLFPDVFSARNLHRLPEQLTYSPPSVDNGGASRRFHDIPATRNQPADWMRWDSIYGNREFRDIYHYLLDT